MLKNNLPITADDLPATDWSEHYIALQAKLTKFFNAMNAGNTRTARAIIMDADSTMFELELSVRKHA